MAGGISRPIRLTGLVAAGLLLTACFMWLRFPYDELAVALESRLERATGQRISLGALGPHLHWLGPGLAARGVRVARPDGGVLDLDRVTLRPAWSASWLLGKPAFFVTLRGALGEAAGRLRLGDPPRFAGAISRLDLAQLPASVLAPGARLAGAADADLDLVAAADGPAGTLALVARDGTLEHPALPLAIPFEELTAQLHLGGEQRAEILSLELRSRLVTGSLSGTLGRGPSPATSPLRLEGSFTLGGEIRGALNAQGVAIGKGGVVQFVVMGTPERPIVR